MIEIFRVDIHSEHDLDECVNWARSVESRKAYPGTRDVVSKQGGFFYKVEMKAPGVSHGIVTVEEHLQELERDGPEAWFESGLHWCWPTGQIVSAWAEYQFSETDQGTRIAYTQRYHIPRKALGVIFNHVRLGRSVRKAATRYLEGLALCGASESHKQPASSATTTPR